MTASSVNTMAGILRFGGIFMNFTIKPLIAVSTRSTLRSGAH